MSVQPQTEEKSTKSETYGEEKFPESLSRNEAFELLSNERRRYAIHYIKQSGGPVELGALSERVAAWENETSINEVSSDERKCVYTSLQQFHLPKMAEEEVIEFDDRQGTVALSARAEDLDVYLEVVDGWDIPWSEYYLGLAAVNLALVVSSVSSIYPISMLSSASWAVFAAVTFLVSALLHTYFSTEMRLGQGDKPPEVGE